MSEKFRVLPRSWDELERMAQLTRNAPPSPTREDIPRLREKKIPYWGRKRRKFTGP